MRAGIYLLSFRRFSFSLSYIFFFLSYSIIYRISNYGIRFSMSCTPTLNRIANGAIFFWQAVFFRRLWNQNKDGGLYYVMLSRSVFFPSPRNHWWGNVYGFQYFDFNNIFFCFPSFLRQNMHEADTNIGHRAESKNQGRENNKP